MKNTRRLHITMRYMFTGDTGIDVPESILAGKTEEEQLEAAYKYAHDHIDEIPVAENAEYVCDSDTFELDDIDFDAEEKSSKWSEIRCNYFDEEEKKYIVDAWKTCDDNEEGLAIAKIDLADKTVVYLDEDAKTDGYAQTIINEMLQNEYVLAD